MKVVTWRLNVNLHEKNYRDFMAPAFDKVRSAGDFIQTVVITDTDRYTIMDTVVE